MIDSKLLEIYNHLQDFTILLDRATSYQSKILKLAQSTSWESVEFMTLNRDRLNNIIENEQEKIYKSFIRYTREKGISTEVQNLLLAWQNDTTLWIEKSRETDENILVSLKDFKSKTSKQLSKLFKSKQAHKGYSLRK